MTQVTINSLDAHWNAGLLAHAVKAIGKAVRSQIRLRQTRRTIIAELEQFSPGEIAELGISHADISHVAEDWTRR